MFLYNAKNWLPRLVRWREQHIKDRQFILMLSFVVGIGTALAALLLKQLIHWIQWLLTDHFDTTEANYLYLVYPVAGILLTGLFVRHVVKDPRYSTPSRAARGASSRTTRGRPSWPAPSPSASAARWGRRRPSC